MEGEYLSAFSAAALAYVACFYGGLLALCAGYQGENSAPKRVGAVLLSHCGACMAVLFIYRVLQL